MTLPVRLEPEAKDDLAGVDHSIQRTVQAELENLEQDGLNHDDVHFYEDSNGRRMYRLRMKDDINHVVFFDVEDGAAVIYGVFHRDDAYEPDIEAEMHRRLH